MQSLKSITGHHHPLINSFITTNLIMINSKNTLLISLYQGQQMKSFNMSSLIIIEKEDDLNLCRRNL